MHDVFIPVVLPHEYTILTALHSAQPRVHPSQTSLPFSAAQWSVYLSSTAAGIFPRCENCGVFGASATTTFLHSCVCCASPVPFPVICISLLVHQYTDGTSFVDAMDSSRDASAPSPSTPAPPTLTTAQLLTALNSMVDADRDSLVRAGACHGVHPCAGHCSIFCV